MDTSLLAQRWSRSGQGRPAGLGGPARPHATRRLYAAAAAAVAITTMGATGVMAAGTASAAAQSAGAQVYTTSQAGYVTGGRWFRYVASTVKVAPARSFTSYAEVVLGGRGTTPVTLAVKAGGGPASVGFAVGIQPFGMGGGALAKVAPKAGDLVRLSLYWNRHATSYSRYGTVYATATDLTSGRSQTQALAAGPGIYTAAESAGVVSNATVAAPQASTRLWALRDTKVTTCTGVHGSLYGPWATSTIVDTRNGGPSGRVVISPSPLWNYGQNFGVYLRPTA